MIELDRRQFLKMVTLGGMGLVIAACGGQLPKVPYTVTALQKLGKELGGWKLADGTLMAGRFPEIKRSADLLSGALDPAQYFPFIKIPMGFSLLTGSDTATLVMQRIADLNDPRKIVVTTKEGLLLNIPILARDTPVEIAMSQDVQLFDYPDYTRAYVNYLKATYGINFSLSNPDSIPTSENEVMISVVNNTALDRSLTGRERFRIFVDNGSFLRSGIAFANWYQDQLYTGSTPQGAIVETGLRVTDFLMKQGLIRKQDRLFVWAAGKAPEITDPKFLELVNSISTGS